MIQYNISYKDIRSRLYLSDDHKGKIVILLPGLPESSNISKLAQVFTEAGAHVIYPYLSGSFNSGGDFLGEQHIQDISTFVEIAKQKKVTELYFEKELDLGEDNEIVLMGMSYSGVIALHGASAHKEDISQLILLSPVLLYNQEDINTIIDFDFSSQMKHLVGLLQRAFPYTYRVSDYEKLNNFLLGKIGGLRKEKVETLLQNINIPTLLVHGTKDSSVPYQISKTLVESAMNQKIETIFQEHGHGNSSYTDSVIKSIKDFLS